MTERTRRNLVIAAACVLCTALAVSIVLRFAGGGSTQPEIISVTDAPVKNEPVVDIKSGIAADAHDTDTQETDDLGGGDSTGTEQTIQAAPVKPQPPAPPSAPNTSVKQGQEHTNEDVPEKERNTETPPSYSQPPVAGPAPSEPTKPESGTGGQVYVPGFGYVESRGAGSVTVNDNMYENGNKVGTMG